jgi:hypothetical protein
MKNHLSLGPILALCLSCAFAGCSTDARQDDAADTAQQTPPAAAAKPKPASGQTAPPPDAPQSTRPQADAAKMGAPPTNADAALLKDFKDRIDAYMKLHDKQEKGKADPKETSSPEKIKATQDALAAKIQAARKDAKPGDIFTPEIRQLFRRLMHPELKGPDAAETKRTIKEDSVVSKAQVLKVNARYPEGAPLPTVPPNLLVRLPQLPEDLEYRIVNKDLILRDVNANLIVDFIPNAIH